MSWAAAASKGLPVAPAAAPPESSEPSTTPVAVSPQPSAAASVDPRDEWQIVRKHDRHRTARRLCDGYNDRIYATMRDDQVRSAGYAAAIAAHVPGKVVLDIGTGALALLAVMAARAGAAHVYAIEVNHEAYLKAIETVREAGLNGMVTVLHGFSTELELPQRVEVIVHEIIGEIATLEGVVVALRDALPRFGSPSGCVSIPDRVSSLVAPAMVPDKRYWKDRACADPCEGREDAASDINPKGNCYKIWEFPARLLLAEPQVFESIPFNQGLEAIPEVQLQELEFGVSRGGAMRGLVIHIDLELDSNTRIGSRCSNSHWANYFVKLNAVEVKRGDTVHVKSITDLNRPTPEYTFEVYVQTISGEKAASTRVTVH